MEADWCLWLFHCVLWINVGLAKETERNEFIRYNIMLLKSDII